MVLRALVLGFALIACEDPPSLTPQRIEAPPGTAKALLDTHLANAPVDAGVLDDHRWDFSAMHPHGRPSFLPVDAGPR